MKVLSFLVLSFLLISTTKSFGQLGMNIPRSIVKDGKYAFLAGYNYNRNHTGELGIARGWRCNYESPCDEMIAAEMIYYYAALSSEFMIYDEQLVVCPKFGYHIVFGGISLGVNALDYTNFDQHKIGVRPEIGLSFGGLLGACYGYNFTSHKDLFNISNHNLGIRIIVGSGLFVDEEWRQKRKARSLKSQEQTFLSRKIRSHF